MELHPIIYNLMIDPLLKGVRARILTHMSPGLKVVDIASGTGELARAMASAGHTVTGVDIDTSMIRFAGRKKNHLLHPRLSFKVADVKAINHFDNQYFDLATMSLALHQFYPSEWGTILKEVFRISKELLIADYHFPLPPGAKKNLVYLVERIAGKEHSQNFRSFMEEGGVIPIIEKAGYTCTHEETSGSGIFGVYRINYFV